uniref:DDE Tnp4 domain-containing protein n=1 Tax=Lactuca sativa TaxID=4236 RepID=A0A9R1WLL2_LACSA|nr:hypothetical protein LSAT_V11C100023760 [Lactuca sativa]
MSVEEHVARFLHIVGNDFRNRFVSWLYRLFKSTTRAIDGTHVRVKVSNKDAPRYHGHKGHPMINVLAACTFDLKFMYILSGWEGTTSYSRILKSALNREDKLVIPKVRYCLVDDGLPHTTTLMAPYRGVRYHLKEYSAWAPENAEELFNLHHASLRNVIERAFGALKRRFPIIRSTHEPFYSCETQSDLFLACCILHNFLLQEDRDKNLEDEVIMIKEEQVIKKEQINWTDLMDYCFIQSMLTQLENILRISGSFIPLAYTNMVEEPSQKFEKSLTKQSFKELFENFKFVFFTMDDDDGGGGGGGGDDDIQVLSPTCFSQMQNSSSKKYKRKKKKRRHEVKHEDEPEVEPESFEKVIMSAVKDVASAMREGKKIFENSHHHVYTGDEIYNELESMDLEPDELAEALMFLSRKQSNAGTLFKVPFKI